MRNSIFVMTNFIKTEQKQSVCDEVCQFKSFSLLKIAANSQIKTLGAWKI